MQYTCRASCAHETLCCRGITVEYQRQQAKALQQYFRELNTQKIAQGSKCVPGLPQSVQASAEPQLPALSTSSSLSFMPEPALSLASDLGTVLQAVRLDGAQRDLERAVGDVRAHGGLVDGVRDRRQLPGPDQAAHLVSGHC